LYSSFNLVDYYGFHCSIFATRAFSVASPTAWNSLPDSLRDPAVESERSRLVLENTNKVKVIK